MLLSQNQIDRVLKILATPCKTHPPAQFDFIPKNWGKWKRRLLRYLQDSELRSLSERQKIDVLMYLIGDQRDELHLQLSRMGLTDQHNFAQVLQRINEHFKMTKSIIYRRFHFNNRDQQEGESVNEYITSVKKLADVCEYGHLRDEMIVDRLIAGIVSENARQEMLDCDHLTLEQAVRIIHCHELKGSRRQGV